MIEHSLKENCLGQIKEYQKTNLLLYCLMIFNKKNMYCKAVLFSVHWP